MKVSGCIKDPPVTSSCCLFDSSLIWLFNFIKIWKANVFPNVVWIHVAVTMERLLKIYNLVANPENFSYHVLKILKLNSTLISVTKIWNYVIKCKLLKCDDLVFACLINEFLNKVNIFETVHWFCDCPELLMVLKVHHCRGSTMLLLLHVFQ